MTLINFLECIKVFNVRRTMHGTLYNFGFIVFQFTDTARPKEVFCDFEGEQIGEYNSMMFRSRFISYLF